jgi:putative two-component system response regulator
MVKVPADIGALHILIVDDEPANVRVIERILHRAGFTSVATETDAALALSIIQDREPDIVLLDLHMPKLTGVDVLREIKRSDLDAGPLFIMLTGDDTKAARASALAAGARDFITKPFDAHEVALRLQNFAELRLLHKRLQQSNASLESEVRARTADLDEARLEILDRLGKAAEFRDDATGQHTRRVGTMSGRIARVLSLSQEAVELIERAGPLHDVGKIGIPDAILLKPGPLDHGEMQVMRRHTIIGGDLLAPSRSPLLQLAAEVALSHHERWDGAGYPRGLAGNEIPLAARIVAVADFYDALSHDRPYRNANAPDEVIELISSERGKHFDPEVVDAFLDVRRADY